MIALPGSPGSHSEEENDEAKQAAIVFDAVDQLIKATNASTTASRASDCESLGTIQSVSSSAALGRVQQLPSDTAEPEEPLATTEQHDDGTSPSSHTRTTGSSSLPHISQLHMRSTPSRPQSGACSRSELVNSLFASNSPERFSQMKNSRHVSGMVPHAQFRMRQCRSEQGGADAESEDLRTHFMHLVYSPQEMHH